MLLLSSITTFIGFPLLLLTWWITKPFWFYYYNWEGCHFAYFISPLCVLPVTCGETCSFIAALVRAGLACWLLSSVSSQDCLSIYNYVHRSRAWYIFPLQSTKWILCFVYSLINRMSTPFGNIYVFSVLEKGLYFSYVFSFNKIIFTGTWKSLFLGFCGYFPFTKCVFCSICK